MNLDSLALIMKQMRLVRETADELLEDLELLESELDELVQKETFVDEDVY